MSTDTTSPIVVVSDALPERNGVGAYYRDLADQLDDPPVTMICPDGSASEWLNIPLPGDKTQRLGCPSPRWLTRRLRDLAPTAVVIPTPGPYGLIGMRIAKKLGLRTIAGFHTHYGGLTDLYWGRIRGKITQQFFTSVNRYLFRNADVVAAMSSDMVPMAEALGARQITVVGTLLPKVFLETPTRPGTGKLERILFAGRLAAEKNIDAVLDAATELETLHFTVAGDGPMKDAVVGRVNSLPNVDYLGWVTRSQLMNAVDDTDLVVLPSHVEAFGTVAFEAMARERLALVSPNCGILDWSPLNESLCRIGVEESVADAIRRLAIGSADERRQRAMANSRNARLLHERSLEQWRRLAAPHVRQRAA